jgi:hypothetical protein
MSIFLIFFSKPLIHSFLDNKYPGFLHYKIARDIKNNHSSNLIRGLNEWMLNNYMTNAINEEYLPVLDKSSNYRIIDGYSVCDGAADTYIRIGEFLDIRGYVVALFNKNLDISPHTITLFTPNKKKLSSIKYLRDNALVIEPLYDITFMNRKSSASLNKICEGIYNIDQKKYLSKFDYSFEKNYCYTRDVWLRNKPISKSRLSKRFYYFLLDLLPEYFLFKIHQIYINKEYNENNFFLKARNFDLFGNKKLALKYYKLTISKKIDQEYDIFFGAFEGGSYHQKKSINKTLSLEDYSIFFITLLENTNKNILIKNPFVKSQEPFYRLYESYYNQKLYYNKLN